MVQILPVDDIFDAGSPAYATTSGFLSLYLGCPVSTSAVSGLWLPSGSAFVVRPMHAAYQTTNSQGIPDYNSAFHSNGSSTTRACSGAVFRREFSAGVTVSGIFELRALAGGAMSISEVAPRGVMARVSAGSLAGDGTADARVQNVDCYMAAVYQKSDATLRLGIIRWNGGAFTLLSESAAINTTGFQWGGLVTVTLVIIGSVTVTLAATMKGFGSGIAIGTNTADSSGSRITAAGRCGFFSSSDRVINGKTVVDLCHLFSVQEGATLVLQDEFQRLSLAASKQSSTDAAGTTGSGYLSSAFYWDTATFDGTDVEGANTFIGTKRLRRNVTAGRVDFDHQIDDDNVGASRTAAGRLILSQRLADNFFSQHRSADVIVPSAPTALTGEVWTGVALRANQAKPRDQTAGTPLGISTNPNTPAGTGYVLAVRAQTSTQVTWQLHRIVNNGHLFLARKTETSPFPGSNAFPGYGSQFNVDLDVHPRDAADPFGVVELVCKVDGNALAFTSFQAGADSGVPGTVIDGSSTRIQSGAGEGLFVCNGLTSTGTDVSAIDPIFENWIQGALTNAVVIDQDQPSVAVFGEATATGTALDTIIGSDWPFEVEYRSFEVSNPFDSGHRQTMPRHVDGFTDTLIPRLLFHFHKRGVRATEFADLLAHWNVHKGLELGFEFTPPNDSTYTVHYVADSLRYALIAAGIYEVEFDLEGLR